MWILETAVSISQYRMPLLLQWTLLVLSMHLQESSAAPYAIVLVQEKHDGVVLPAELAGWIHGAQAEVKLVETDGGVYHLLSRLCDIHTNWSIAAIADASKSTTAFYTQTFAHTRDLLYIRLANQLADVQATVNHSAALIVHHPQQILIKALRALFMKEKIPGAAILYDQYFSIEQQSHEFMYNIFTYHQFFQLNSSAVPDVKQILRTSRIRELLYIVLGTSNQTTERIFEQMETQTHIQDFHFIILRKQRAMPLCRTCTKPQPVLVLDIDTQLATPSTCYFRGRTVAVYAICTLDFVATNLQAYLAAGHSIRTTPAPNCSEISSNKSVEFANFVSNRSISSSLGKFSPAQRQFQLSSNVLFRHGNSTTIPLLNIARWNNAQNKIIRIDPSSNISMVPKVQQVFRVMTLHSPPFVFKRTRADGTLYFEGMCIDIISKIAETGGFKLEFLEPADQRFGGFNANGSWNGMINELIQDRADIIAAPLSVMEERATVVDYTNPFYEPVGITILYARPYTRHNLFRFVEVYDAQVWGLIILALIIVSLLIGLADAFGPLGSVRNPERDTLVPEPRQFTFLESLWFCVISMTPQGGGDLPVGFSARMLAVSWWLFGFLIISTYTANLAAFLTVSRLDSSISSIDDLAKQTKIKYATIQGTASQEYFRRMKNIENRFYNIWKDLSLSSNQNPMQRAQLAVWEYPMSEKFTGIWRAMENSGFPPSFEEALKRVKTGGFALLNDATLNKYAAQNDCDLVSIGSETSQKAYAFAVQKGSYLKEIISQNILELNNNRFLERRRVHWWAKDKKSCPKVTNVSQGIGLDSIGGVFVLIPIGLVLGALLLLGENLYYRHKEKKMRKVEGRSNVKTIVVNGGENTNEEPPTTNPSEAPKENGVTRRCNDNPSFVIE